eukprot:scaffold4453_cov24-Tisochrysis_lutea.AAC.1
MSASQDAEGLPQQSSSSPSNGSPSHINTVRSLGLLHELQVRLKLALSCIAGELKVRVGTDKANNQSQLLGDHAQKCSAHAILNASFDAC